MIEYQIIPIILIYILIALAWSDFIHAMMLKSDSTTWNRTRKILVGIFWPINFLAFIIGLIYALSKTTNN